MAAIGNAETEAYYQDFLALSHNTGCHGKWQFNSNFNEPTLRTVFTAPPNQVTVVDCAMRCGKVDDFIFIAPSTKDSSRMACNCVQKSDPVWIESRRRAPGISDEMCRALKCRDGLGCGGRDSFGTQFAVYLVANPDPRKADKALSPAAQGQAAASVKAPTPAQAPAQAPAPAPAPEPRIPAPAPSPSPRIQVVAPPQPQPQPQVVQRPQQQPQQQPKPEPQPLPQQQPPPQQPQQQPSSGPVNSGSPETSDSGTSSNTNSGTSPNNNSGGSSNTDSGASSDTNSGASSNTNSGVISESPEPVVVAAPSPEEQSPAQPAPAQEPQNSSAASTQAQPAIEAQVPAASASASAVIFSVPQGRILDTVSTTAAVSTPSPLPFGDSDATTGRASSGGGDVTAVTPTPAVLDAVAGGGAGAPDSFAGGNSDDTPPSNSFGKAIGIGVGVGVVILAIIAAVVYIMVRRRSTNVSDSGSSEKVFSINADTLPTRRTRGKEGVGKFRKKVANLVAGKGYRNLEDEDLASIGRRGTTDAGVFRSRGEGVRWQLPRFKGRTSQGGRGISGDDERGRGRGFFSPLKMGGGGSSDASNGRYDRIGDEMVQKSVSPVDDASSPSSFKRGMSTATPHSHIIHTITRQRGNSDPPIPSRAMSPDTDGNPNSRSNTPPPPACFITQALQRHQRKEEVREQPMNIQIEVTTMGWASSLNRGSVAESYLSSVDSFLDVDLSGEKFSPVGEESRM
ncbi:hypothetical protein HDU67_003759 [Dinochytrium kinnereticum]|nr:hypothetical protein HDU67_003759 [Dinochytrium kinnereticum]